MKLKWLYLLAFSLFLSPVCFSQKFDFKENAVYILNLVKYTDWPSAKTEVSIGIVGTTNVESELIALIAKKKNSKVTYSLKKIKPEEAKSVDVIIFSENSGKELGTIQPQIDKLPILVIAQKEDQARLGACISLFIDEDDNFKTKYQLSLKNCKAKGLTISEQIISNAVLVK